MSNAKSAIIIRLSKGYVNFSFWRHIDACTKLLKIGFDGEEELVDEDGLEGCDIVLLVEHKYGLFVVDWIYCAEWNRAIAIGDENTVAHYAGCAFIAVGECLNVAEQNKCEKSFLEDIALAVDEAHGIFKCLADLELVVQRSVMCPFVTPSAIRRLSVAGLGALVSAEPISALEASGL